MQFLNLLFFFVKTACNKQTFSHYNCSIIFVTKWIVIFMVIGMLATPWFLFQVAIPVAQGVLESVPTLVTQGSRSKSFSLQFVDRLLSGEQCKEIVLLRDWEIIEKLSYFSFSRFAGSVVRAANDTSPLLLEGIAEFTGSHHTITVHITPYLVIMWINQSSNHRYGTEDIIHYFLALDPFLDVFKSWFVLSRNAYFFFIII